MVAAETRLAQEERRTVCDRDRKAAWNTKKNNAG